MPQAGSSRAITESFGGYSLAGQYLLAPGATACGLLAIHGARSDLRRLAPLLQPMCAAGTGSLAFDLSGHGERSPLPLARTSLGHNLREALQFARLLGDGPDTVFGHSLGGALALKVAEHCERTVKTLILSGPALYPEAAFSVPHYGPDFTRVLSAPFAFEDSASLAFLRRFRGRVILVSGQYDGLPAERHGGRCGRAAGQVTVEDDAGHSRPVYSPIPAEVFERIRDAAGGRLSEIVLEGCDHKLFQHLDRHPQAARSLAQALCRSLNGSERPTRRRVAVTGAVVAG